MVGMTDDQLANWKSLGGKPWPTWPCGGFRMAKASVPRGPNRFTERELARALRAAHRAGGVARVEVDLDGRIVLFTAKPESASGNDLDNWLAKRGKDARPT
jgi:hypothetical protein